jgi:hypothetical protein
MGPTEQGLLLSAAALLVAGVLALRLTARGRALLARGLSSIGSILSFFALSVEPVSKDANYVVVTRLPSRAYDGESFIALLGVACTSRGPFLELPHLEIRPDSYPNATFAIELSAPSFDKDPSEATMIGPVAAGGQALARWVLHAKASGNQLLLFRIYHNSMLVGEYETSVRVTKAFGMTANQVFAVGCVLGLLSGLLAAASTLKALLSK